MLAVSSRGEAGLPPSEVGNTAMAKLDILAKMPTAAVEGGLRAAAMVEAPSLLMLFPSG